MLADHLSNRKSYVRLKTQERYGKSVTGRCDRRGWLSCTGKLKESLLIPKWKRSLLEVGGGWFVSGMDYSRFVGGGENERGYIFTRIWKKDIDTERKREGDLCICTYIHTRRWVLDPLDEQPPGTKILLEEYEEIQARDRNKRFLHMLNKVKRLSFEFLENLQVWCMSD